MDAKSDNAVETCAYTNPILGDGFCGNELSASCEITSGTTGTDAFNWKFMNLKAIRELRFMK